MSKKQTIIIIIGAAIIAGGVFYFISGKNIFKSKSGKQIEIKESGYQEGTPANQGNVSPISGLACDNWNRRPIAVMQPGDVSARPASGFYYADMVIEMPVITASITRLMGVYICGNPEDVGSMRSARHDYVALAKGLDAIFVHWGRSDIATFKDLLDNKIIDNMNCNDDAGRSANKYCYRNETIGRGVDSGYAKFAKLLEGAKDFGYRLENKFAGYPHQAEATLEERGRGGSLRVAFAGPFAVEYEYDRESNTYKRIWGNLEDKDRNNGQRIAPKNIAVIIARSEQIEGQYNNVQIGDPWYDETDNGEAYYYFNGQEYKGTWKKDKSKADSKLFFYNESGQEIKFVPGQIWVEILEPGQALKWTPTL